MGKNEQWSTTLHRRVEQHESHPKTRKGTQVLMILDVKNKYYELYISKYLQLRKFQYIHHIDGNSVEMFTSSMILSLVFIAPYIYK